MFEISTDPKKIKDRIRRHERAVRNEKKKYGGYDDGAGKRYILGPLYLLLDDIEGALQTFEWFKQEFPDDVGEPLKNLCWTLALYRVGDSDSEIEQIHDRYIEIGKQLKDEPRGPKRSQLVAEASKLRRLVAHPCPQDDYGASLPAIQPQVANTRPSTELG